MERVWSSWTQIVDLENAFMAFAIGVRILFNPIARFSLRPAKAVKYPHMMYGLTRTNMADFFHTRIPSELREAS